MSDDHTRGPWRASESDTRPGLWAVWADAGMAGIAQVAIIPNELVHAEGNARLIAKAPDLLAENERLREALQMIADGRGVCRTCGKPAEGPGTGYVSCDVEGKRCSWGEADAQDIARAALNAGGEDG